MLSESHKQAILTLKTIFIKITTVFKLDNQISIHNINITLKYKNLAEKEAAVQYPNDYIKRSSLEFSKYNNYIANNASKEYKEFINWQSLMPFLTPEKNLSGNTCYCLKGVNKYFPIWNHKIVLTLLHILYNRLKNKKRGHTKDDNAYIEKNKEFYKTICERMEMQQFLLETHKESTNANSCT